MSETSGINYREDIEFIRDKTDYYLLPGQIWYNKLLTHYTLSSVSESATGEKEHVFELAELGKQVDSAQHLANEGWQVGAYVGKIMTSSDQQLTAFPAHVKDNYDKKSPWSDLRCPDLPRPELIVLIKKHIGLTTCLFASRPEGDGEDSAQLVAGVTNSDKQIARLVPDYREESYYGYFLPDVERVDSKEITDNVWKSLLALHRVFYDQTVTAIIAHALDNYLAPPLRFRQLELFP